MAFRGEDQVNITHMKILQKETGKMILYTLVVAAVLVMTRARLKLPNDEPFLAIILLALMLFLASFVLAAGVIVLSMTSRIKERDGEGPTGKKVRLAETSAFVASFLGCAITIAGFTVGMVRFGMALWPYLGYR